MRHLPKVPPRPPAHAQLLLSSPGELHQALLQGGCCQRVYGAEATANAASWGTYRWSKQAILTF